MSCTSLNNFLLVFPQRTPCSTSIQPFSSICSSDFSRLDAVHMANAECTPSCGLSTELECLSRLFPSVYPLFFLICLLSSMFVPILFLFHHCFHSSLLSISFQFPSLSPPFLLSLVHIAPMNLHFVSLLLSFLDNFTTVLIPF